MAHPRITGLSSANISAVVRPKLALIIFLVLDTMPFTASFEGVIISFSPYFLRCWPRKSKPSSIRVIRVFSPDRFKPLWLRKSPIAGITFSWSICLDFPVTIKSSAYRITWTFAPLGTAFLMANSNPSKVLLASTGDMIAPWGVPALLG